MTAGDGSRIQAPTADLQMVRQLFAGYGRRDAVRPACRACRTLAARSVGTCRATAIRCLIAEVAHATGGVEDQFDGHTTGHGTVPREPRLPVNRVHAVFGSLLALELHLAYDEWPWAPCRGCGQPSDQVLRCRRWRCSVRGRLRRHCPCQRQVGVEDGVEVGVLVGVLWGGVSASFRK